MGQLPAAGLCMVRDARDLMPFLVGHYLRMGLDRLVFIDDGSTDGTRDYLERLAVRDPERIHLRKVDSDSYEQAERMDEGANDLIAAGYRLIVPFDSDEFWSISRPAMERLRADPTPRQIIGRWSNFLQARKVMQRTRFGPLRMSHRRMPPADNDTVRRAVESGREGFTAIDDWKVAFVATEPVRLSFGQHVLLDGPRAKEEQRFDVLHLPFRSRDEIIRRGTDHEQRRRPTRRSHHEAWQSAYHGQVVCDGRVDAYWAANSVDGRGQIDLGDRTVAAVPDGRLRRCLASALVHVVLRYGRHGL